MILVDEEKRNSNYKPRQFSYDPSPRLLFSSLPDFPNYYNLIKTDKSLSYLSFSDPNPIPSQMSEDPTKVARSVVAACLLKLLDEIPVFKSTKSKSESESQSESGSDSDPEPVFTLVNSEDILFHLNRNNLICPLEKEALIKVGEVNSESDSDAMISAVNSALVSIEKDTGGVTCYLARNLSGKGKDIIYAMSVQPDVLVKELLPVSLNFQSLALPPDRVSNFVEYERRKRKNLKLLYG